MQKENVYNLLVMAALEGMDPDTRGLSPQQRYPTVFDPRPLPPLPPELLGWGEIVDSQPTPTQPNPVLQYALPEPARRTMSVDTRTLFTREESVIILYNVWPLLRTRAVTRADEELMWEQLLYTDDIIGTILQEFPSKDMYMDAADSVYRERYDSARKRGNMAGGINSWHSEVLDIGDTLYL